MPYAVRLLNSRSLDGDDAFESAGRLHLERLKEEVNSGAGVDLAVDDPNAPHAEIIARLHYLMISGSAELQKSICLGLVFAILMQLQRDAAGQGGVISYWEYLAALRTFDTHSVAVRALLGAAQRFHMLTQPVQERLRYVVQDMVAGHWDGCGDLLLALQREVQAGDPRPAARSLCRRLLDIVSRNSQWLVASAPRVAALSFLWALRWVSALQPGDKGEEPLRKAATSLVAKLWQEARKPVLDLGQLLLWALTPCRGEQGFAEVWQLVAEDDAKCRVGFESDTGIEEGLMHLLSPQEQEQLNLLLRFDAGQRNEAWYVEWFLSSHFGPTSGGSDAHFADVILCSFWIVERAKKTREAGLWRRFLDHALAGQLETCDQAFMGFIFAARHPGKPRNVLKALLEEGCEQATIEKVVQLGQRALIPELAAELQSSITAQRT